MKRFLNEQTETPLFSAHFRVHEESFELHYTCDKQVLWESAGAFFPRDNSLVSDRKSHSLNLWPWQLLAVGQLPALVATSGTWHRG